METISNGFEVTALPPGDHGYILVEQAGPRRLRLIRNGNGSVDLQLDKPPLKKLVLSGGGAKGVAYSGAVSALEKNGALLGINALYGSSAGAIMAALVASGMNATQFDALSDETDLLSLLESSNKSLGWLQRAFSSAGETAQNILPDSLGYYSRLLLSVLPRLQSGAQPLQELIRDKSRETVLACIAASGLASAVEEVAEISNRLKAGGEVSFADLAQLNVHIPHIKTLHVTGTAMFDGMPQLLVFNAALTPDMDIALAVHISAALPAVFQKPGKAGLQFQEYDEVTLFQDGGVLLNTPVPQLIDPGLTPDALGGSDMLILRFEKRENNSKPGGLFGALTDWLAGAPVSAARDYQRKSLEAFADQTVIVPLKTNRGDFSTELNGTLNFTMTSEIKNYLQALLHDAVEEHLAARLEQRMSYRFASLDDALLSMDEDMLANLPQGSEAAAITGLCAWRQAALAALAELESAVIAANAVQRLELTSTIRIALSNLDQRVQGQARLEWLAGQLNRPDKPNFQQLLQAMRGWSLDSRLGAAAMAEMRKRDIQVIAANIRRAVIYPSLHLLGQTSKNIELLLRCDELLTHANSDVEVNQALDEIIKGYRSRNPLLSKPIHAETITLAQAWKIRQR